MKILFTGDLTVANKQYNISSEIIKIFAEADYSIVNLESPILYDEKINRYPKVGPCLFQKTNVIEILKNLNIGYASGANNHIIDYGEIGIKSTMEILEKNNIQFGGFGLNEEQSARQLNLKNSNVSIICACEEEFGVAAPERFGSFSIYNEEIIKKITNLKKDNKYIIIFAHGGPEEVPLPSKYIIKRYRELINSGADLVVGHHPHVIQGYEKYKNKNIFYSLGNFIHQSFSLSKGTLLFVNIEKNDATSFKLFPIKMETNFLKILNEQSLINYLNKLNNISAQPNLFEAIYQEQAIYMYENYYEKYFTGLFLKNKSLIRKILSMFKNHLVKKSMRIANQKDRLLLLHLLRNNSHKEFIETALKILTGEIKDLRSEKTKQIFQELNNFIIAIQKR